MGESSIAGRGFQGMPERMTQVQAGAHSSGFPFIARDDAGLDPGAPFHHDTIHLWVAVQTGRDVPLQKPE